MKREFLRSPHRLPTWFVALMDDAREETMPREQRLELIRRIEQRYDSRLISVVWGDRPVCTTQIADDSLRPLYDHLLSIGTIPRLQLFLYSIGGHTQTPWKIVSTLRGFCNSLEVIIPYKAYSSATLISMGADKIYMTRKAELGPVDPALVINPSDGGPSNLILRDLGVEDVAAFVSFLKNRAGLTDQAALSQLITVLAQSLTPPLLGRIERVYSHIRLVSRKLLDLCKPALEDRVVTSVIEALTEKTYVHNHGIGREEARQIGMQVEFLKDEAEDDVWNLFTLYEDELHLRETSDFESLIPVGAEELEQPNTAAALMESTALVHGFVGSLNIRRIRKIPPQPTINVNLQLQLPAGLDINALPQNAQQILQQLVQQAAQHTQGLVRQELINQSPVERVEAKIKGGAWRQL